MNFRVSILFSFYERFISDSPDSPLIARERCLELCNRPLYRYGGHIELIRFEEYYGMPKGHSLSIYARFSGKKRTSLYISREKGDHFTSTAQRPFFPLQSFSRKTLRKIGPKSARKY